MLDPSETRSAAKALVAKTVSKTPTPTKPVAQQTSNLFNPNAVLDTSQVQDRRTFDLPIPHPQPGFAPNPPLGSDHLPFLEMVKQLYNGAQQGTGFAPLKDTEEEQIPWIKTYWDNIDKYRMPSGDYPYLHDQQAMDYVRGQAIRAMIEQRSKLLGSHGSRNPYTD